MEEEDPPCLRDAGNLTIAGLADAGNPTLESWNVVVVEAVLACMRVCRKDLCNSAKELCKGAVQQRFAVV